MANEMFVMQIMFAVFVTLKSGMKKVKLHLDKEVEMLMDGEAIKTKDVWVFATQLYDVLIEQGINILRLKPSELAFAMRNAVIKFRLEKDEDGLWQNVVIEEIILTDNGIDSMVESILLEQLTPAQREKRLEKQAEATAKAAKAAAAKARAALNATDKVVELEHKLAEAEAAVEADPTPSNKGKLTKARKALAAAQA